MSPVVVNLEGVKTTLELVPDGVYPARFTKRTFGQSKTKNPKVDLEFIFDPEAGEGAAGRKAFVTCSLQTQALFKIKKTLIEMGADPESLEGPIDLEKELDDLIGASATIRVGHHEYNDTDHNDFDVVSNDSWTA
jgi:hypothetical protein